MAESAKTDLEQIKDESEKIFKKKMMDNYEMFSKKISNSLQLYQLINKWLY